MDKKLPPQHLIDALAAATELLSNTLGVDLIIVADNAELFGVILPEDKHPRETTKLLLKAALANAARGLKGTPEGLTFCVTALLALATERMDAEAALDAAEQAATSATDTIISNMKKDV